MRGMSMLGRIRTSLLARRYRSGVRRLGRGKPPEYRGYLEQQLDRSFSKRENDPGAGARLLVARTVELGALTPEASVLCVGSRNAVELDLFRARGISDVVGIDLFSQSSDILVMDMHAMTFPDAGFDAVYVSHALEHSNDLDRALGEIARVARPGAAVAVEVPVRHRGHEADLIEFAGLADLRSRLEPFVEQVLWEQEEPARSRTNDQGSAVARMVFAIRARS